jgi:hypothetical protein
MCFARRETIQHKYNDLAGQYLYDGRDDLYDDMMAAKRELEAIDPHNPAFN